MCDICSGQVGKGPWELLLKLSLENIFIEEDNWKDW